MLRGIGFASFGVSRSEALLGVQAEGFGALGFRVLGFRVLGLTWALEYHTSIFSLKEPL